MRRSLFLLFVFCAACAAAKEAALRLPGLQAKVLVRYDPYGVPHIRAQDILDAYRVQGYVQGRDRFAQMDFFRRKARGQLAELLGREALADDVDMMTTGIPQVAERIWEESAPQTRAALKAFSDGVNAYITSAGVRTRPWHPVDTIAFGRLMSWRLSETLGEELMFGELVMRHGTEKILDLLDAGVAPPVVKMGRLSPASVEAYARAVARYRPGALLRDLGLSGSNNWVVGPQRTACRCAVLANDPHLSLHLPPIWYEIHITAPGMNVAGVTFPVTPGVIIGHNDRIAWGVTTTGYDVLDVYLEKVAEKKDHLLFEGEAYPIRKEKVVFKIKEGDGIREEEEEIWYSRHGPIVVREGLPGRMVSFRWTGHEPSFEIEAFLKINRAKNLDEFKAALESFAVGAQNFVYADREGNIFYWAPARVPLREGAPFMPLDGSSRASEWKGYIPYEELPQATNPAQGYIATANQRPVAEDYPYYIGLFFDPGYRQVRIEERIKEKPRLSFEEVQAIQGDDLMVHARQIVPHLLASLEGEPAFETPYRLLRDWDYRAAAQSVAASLYHKWVKHLLLTLFAPFGEDGQRLAGRASFSLPALTKMLEGRTRLDWFGARREAVLRKTLQAALDELREMLGKEADQWTWGKLHKLRLGNLLRQSPHPEPIPRHGSIGTVDNAGFNILGDDYHFSGGPSTRFTVQMGETIRAENVLPGGQAGSPSSHYTDQLELWLGSLAHPMLFAEEEVQAGATREEIFRP